MSGLVGYASSDEEDDAQEEVIDAQAKPPAGEDVKNYGVLKAAGPSTTASLRLPVQDAATPAMGPAPGPSMPKDNAFESIYEDAPPQESSYESSREAIRNLTMPPVPNFSIPPSPPGSPPPGSTKKFAHFLKLKKQGVHFNERLQNTPALKNPTLFQKLRQHAGISEEEQYATTLPGDLAVPTSFPPWAYADELNKSQAKIRQKKEDEAKKKPREAIDFVPATGSSASSRTTTPRAGAKSTAERVLLGLDKEKMKSPQLSGRKR